MSRPLRLLNYFLGGVLFIFLIAWATNTYADGCKKGHNCEAPITTNVGTSIGGNKAIGIGLGMGSVDISQCMASKSTPLYQWLIENKWCMADSLDAKGLHEAAARVRCQTKTMRKVYPDRQECLSANLMPTIDEMPVIPDIDTSEHDGRIDELYARLSTLEKHKAQDAEIAKKAAQRARASARQVQRAETSRKELAKSMLDDLREYQ